MPNQTFVPFAIRPSEALGHFDAGAIVDPNAIAREVLFDSQLSMKSLIESVSSWNDFIVID